MEGYEAHEWGHPWGAKIGGYLSWILFEGDVDVIREGGGGKGSFRVVLDVFNRCEGGRAMFVVHDEDFYRNVMDLEWPHGDGGWVGEVGIPSLPDLRCLFPGRRFTYQLDDCRPPVSVHEQGEEGRDVAQLGRPPMPLFEVGAEWGSGSPAGLSRLWTCSGLPPGR